MNRKLIAASSFALLAAAAAPAPAKLAAPPATPESQAKAAEAAAKTAWAGKVDAYKLCQAQDKAVANYHANAAAAGKPVPAAPAMPACADPGPFVYTPPEAPKTP